MMSEGRSSEVSIAGCEGMVGIGLLGDLNRSVHSAVVQVEGDGLRISARRLRLALKNSPTFREAITRFCVTAESTSHDELLQAVHRESTLRLCPRCSRRRDIALISASF